MDKFVHFILPQESPVCVCILLLDAAALYLPCATGRVLTQKLYRRDVSRPGVSGFRTYP